MQQNVIERVYQSAHLSKLGYSLGTVQATQMWHLHKVYLHRPEYDQIKWLRVWYYGMETFYWLIQQKSRDKFFYLMGIVFHLSQLVIQYKWKNVTTAWIICFLLLTNRSTNGWSVELQGGYIKYPCFLCLRESRTDDQEWTLKAKKMK